MRVFIDFISQHWQNIVIPLAVFVLCLIALLRLRKLALDRLSLWAKDAKWPADTILFQPIRRPFFMLCVILSTYLGLVTSIVSSNLKILITHSLWTLFIFAIMLAILSVLNGLILFLGKHFILPGSTPAIRVISNISIIVVCVLVVLGVWGVPTGLLLILIAIAVILVLLVLRDAAPNFFAGFQLITRQHIKTGDSIKLENGEEGCITKMGWSNTQLQTPGGDKLIIPNNQLTKQRIIKIGHYLKESDEPDPVSILTEREMEIARLVTLGMTNKEIAEGLFITENTAKVHLKNILNKLDLKNRQQLAVYTVLKEGVDTKVASVK
jgi:DNA-binding CsgD family transcriptional regulator/small-conductance mechanosensitive channel